MSNMPPRILRLIQVDSVSLSIVALWSNREVRRIDFAPLMVTWEANGERDLAQLSEASMFQSVTLSQTKTLQWKALKRAFTWKGQTRYRATELDPYVLFDHSVFLRKEDSLTGSLLKQAREKAGLSQLDLAQKSHTSSDFISKIESGERFIPLEDLQIIVEQGLGKKLRLEIQ